MIELCALTSAAIFFGAAFYINFAEQPARLQLDAASALTQWKPAYRRGFAMQASLAVLSGLLGLWAWWNSGAASWLVGALLMLANWPFTLIAIMPVNRILETTPHENANAQSRDLIVRWGRLHSVRTLLGFAGVLSFLIALMR